MSLPTTVGRALAGFEGPAEGAWFAPGRVNLIGEHTDYNDGFVLPMALQMGVGVVASRRAGRVLSARSLQAETPVQIDLDTLAPGSVDGWGGYVAGVAWALSEQGIEVPGVDLVLDSDVPSGAGLSSSHALECAVALALIDLAAAELSRTEVARLVQRAENDFVGAPTGIMDQMVSLRGRAGHLLFLDTRSLQVRPVPWQVEQADHCLLVVDTHTPHALVSGEYADRRAACAAAARALGVPALRDIGLDELPAAVGSLDDSVARRRVRHVVTENQRVLDVVAALEAGVSADLAAVGALLTTSHTSMREDFEITVPTVDTAVSAALGAGALGARMTGGGFGGCIVALIARDRRQAVLDRISADFAAAGFAAPSGFVAHASPGARRVL